MQLDLATAFLIDLDELLLSYIVAGGEPPLIAPAFRLRRDEIDDSDCRSDRVVGSGLRAAAQCQHHGEQHRMWDAHGLRPRDLRSEPGFRSLAMHRVTAAHVRLFPREQDALCICR